MKLPPLASLLFTPGNGNTCTERLAGWEGQRKKSVRVKRWKSLGEGAGGGVMVGRG